MQSIVAFALSRDYDRGGSVDAANLTKKEAPLLVHTGKNKTDRWLMVRLKQQDQAGGSDVSQSNSN